MEYYITETEDSQIQTQLPDGFDFAYKNSDGKFVHSTELVDKWPDVDLDFILTELYSWTYEQFLSEKLIYMLNDPIYKSKLIEEKYKPLGEKVINLFMGRNSVEGINNAQSKHVVDKASELTNFLGNGAINDTLASLATFDYDDMTEDNHWLNEERINLVIADIYRLLSEL